LINIRFYSNNSAFIALLINTKRTLLIMNINSPFFMLIFNLKKQAIFLFAGGINALLCLLCSPLFASYNVTFCEFFFRLLVLSFHLAGHEICDYTVVCYEVEIKTMSYEKRKEANAIEIDSCDF
jgi:hypothetical protein